VIWVAVVPVTVLKMLELLVVGPVRPVIVLPFGFVSTRMPKYTCVCAAVFTPVQFQLAPPLWLAAVPLTVQLPPPGSTYTGPPVMVSAEARAAIPSTATIAMPHPDVLG
jgi:hypothetical protein